MFSYDTVLIIFHPEDLPHGHFPESFPTKILYEFLVSQAKLYVMPFLWLPHY
jgi:hypothetical protein